MRDDVCSSWVSGWLVGGRKGRGRKEERGLWLILEDVLVVGGLLSGGV